VAKAWVTRNVNASLEAVGRLKAAEIERWVAERSRDVQTNLGAPLFADTLRQWLDEGRRDDALRRRLLGHLAAVAQVYRNTEVGLYSATEGALLLSATGRQAVFHHRTHAEQAARENGIVLEDFHREEDGRIALGFFIPLGMARTGRPLAVAHVEFDPGVLLYPLIQSWPVASATAETLLVRREADEVVFLNTLRHSAALPLRLRLPVGTPPTPSAVGIAGHVGLAPGRDYRGEPVLAYAMPVAGTPWVLVSKIDEAEVYGQPRTLALLTAALVALFLAAAWWWWAQREREARARYRERRASEARLNEAQRIAHIGSWELDLVANHLSWSDEIFRIFEIDPARFGASYEAFLATVHPEDREMVDRAYTTSVRERVPYETEHRLLFPDGRVKWVRERGETHYGPGEGGRPVRSVGTVQDITALKRAEEERSRQALRVAELSRSLMAVQEQERRELALELHDVVSPNLAAIQLNLELVSADLERPAGEDAAARLADSRALLQETADSLRGICSNLRPAALDYGGLLAALDSYAHQFAGRMGIAVRVCGPEQELPRLPAEAESLLFRIAQEALTNAAKHAGASAMEVALSQDAAEIALTVADDGRGFDPAAIGTPGHKPGLGLLTMRERAEFAGGSFSLESRPGCGTRIRVAIPHPRDCAPSGPLC
jgi:PAS domain S-box-containing protein